MDLLDVICHCPWRGTFCWQCRPWSSRPPSRRAKRREESLYICKYRHVCARVFGSWSSSCSALSESKTSHGTHENETCHACECVAFQIWIIQKKKFMKKIKNNSQKNKFMLHIRMRLVTPEWFMSRIYGRTHSTKQHDLFSERLCSIFICVYIWLIVCYIWMFVRETYNFKEPTDRSRPISAVNIDCAHTTF